MTRVARVPLLLSALLAVPGCRQQPGAARAQQPAIPQPAPVVTGATEKAPAPQHRAPDPAEYAAARREVEATVARRPRDADLRMKSAQFYVRLGHADSALPHLRAATQIASRNVMVWLALGDTATLTDHYGEAAHAYDMAAKLEPRNPFVPRGRGQLLIKQKQFRRAQRVLEAGLSTHPDDIELRTSLGNLYLLLGMPAKAASTLRPAVDAEPGRPDLGYLLGEAYGRDHHLLAAIDEMRKVVAVNPQMDRAWGQIGLYLVTLTRYAEARDPLTRAITLNPGESHLYSALADSYLLDPQEADPLGKSIPLYEKALQLNGRNENALYAYSEALTRRGRNEDLLAAEARLKVLLALNPKNRKAEYKLVEIYRRLGKGSEAAAHLARFESLYEHDRQQNNRQQRSLAYADSPAEHLRLGKRYLQQHELALAAGQFRMVLERAPGSEEARHLLQQAEAQRGRGAGASR